VWHLGGRCSTRTHYINSCWKDADADIPILKEANAEYAKLQSLGKVLPRRSLFTDEKRHISQNQ
jgi:hypothetical protein